MKKQLFWREYRRAAGGGGMTLAVLMLASQVGELLLPTASREDMRSAVHGVALFLFLVFGFVAGERAFSPELKERRLSLLQVLPMSRTALWAVLLGAQCLGAVTAILVAIVCRPSLIGVLRQESAGLLLLPLFALMLGLGASLSLIGRSVVGIYLGGAVAGATCITAMLLAGTFRGVSPEGLQRGAMEPREVGELDSLLPSGIGLTLLAAALLISSWRFFRRGEVLLMRRRVLRGATLLGGLVVVLWPLQLLVMWLPIGVRAEMLPWKVVPSPDASFVAVLSRSEQRLRSSDVYVLDGNSGRVVMRLEVSGVFDLGWAPGGRAIDLVQRRGDRPLLVRFQGGRTHVVRVALDGRPLADKAFDAVSDAWWGSRRVFFVTREAEASQLREWGRPEPLAQILGEPLKLWKAGQRLAALSLRRGVPVSGWVVGDRDVRAVSGPPPTADEQDPAFLIDRKVLWGSAAAEALAEQLGLPVRGAPVLFLVPRSAQSFQSTPVVLDADTAPGIYAAAVDCPTSRAELHVWLAATRSWTKVSASLPVDHYCGARQNEPFAAVEIADAAELQAAFEVLDEGSGILAYVDNQPSGAAVRLFDPALGRSVVVIAVAEPRPGAPAPRVARIGLTVKPELPGPAVRGTAVLVEAVGSRPFRWRYVPGSGRVDVVSASSEFVTHFFGSVPLAGGDLLEWEFRDDVVRFAPDGKPRWSFTTARGSD